ncbi:uncharacterized protein LOC127786099 [Oryza glaberrima]|uniref:uncharacterized protein LOC127786099 n=1 Tax=Oryza glaberrima TaxID=4538 RepID=UPI00224C0E55|nr:uncharacterized protein LOC127786099 [Oryza glaberrima]
MPCLLTLVVVASKPCNQLPIVGTVAASRSSTGRRHPATPSPSSTSEVEASIHRLIHPKQMNFSDSRIWDHAWASLQLGHGFVCGALFRNQAVHQFPTHDCCYSCFCDEGLGLVQEAHHPLLWTALPLGARDQCY